jgi:protein gp37
MSKIEWCDVTWNPIIGCKKVSPGCKNCYAERMAWRLAHMQRDDGSYADVVDENGRWSGNVRLREDVLSKPLHWRKPRVIFVCSMSDLFYEQVPIVWIEAVFNIIAQCKRHAFIILTKRPGRMCEYLLTEPRILSNVHVGTTIEDEATCDERVPPLLKPPAWGRFVSAEPLLGPVNVGDYVLPTPLQGCAWCGGFGIEYVECGNEHSGYDPRQPCRCVTATRIGGVIVGGETGPGARPMNLDWARSIRDQCAEAGVPFFFKGRGGVRKASDHDVLDGRTHKVLPWRRDDDR